MFKLNNKGFAISTILYGALALTILVLMLIFNIMKSSKDMNQELAESIEKNMNNCVLSEVELELCYFNNGECNPTDYYTCIDKEIEMDLLYDVVEIGDFVNYDAGVWAYTGDYTDTLEFYGQQAGVSKNASSTCTGSGLLNGWRVLSKDDNNNVIKLIHAGISECVIIDYDAIAIYQYNYEKVLRGSTSGLPSKDVSSIPKDWSIYVNERYADYAKLLDLEELNAWYQQANNTASNISYSESIFNDIINIGGSYSLSDIGDYGYPISLAYDGSNGTFLCHDCGGSGIRPVVTLKSDVRTTGYITNTYGKKEWIIKN